MENSGVLMQWLATYLVHSTVFAALALASCAVPALRAVHIQDAVLKMALLAGIFSASLQVMTPYGTLLDLRASIAGLESQAVSSQQAHPGAAAAISDRGAKLSSTTAAVLGPNPARARPQTAQLNTDIPLVLIFWGLGIAFMSVRLWSSFQALRRLLTDRQPIAGGPFYQDFRDMSVRAGLKRASLSCTTGLSNPIALLGREVCVPANCLSGMDQQDRRAMLAHEIGHLSRRDPQWQWLYRVVEVLFFLQPLNFVLTTRLSGLSELLSDSWAVQAGSGRRQLANCLLRFARRQYQSLPSIACPMVGPRVTLSNRINRLLEDDSMMTKNTRHSIPLLMAGILAGTLLLPGMTSGMDWFKSDSRGTTVDISGEGNTTLISSHHRGDGVELWIKAKGQFVFSDDDSDLIGINDGGWFELTYKVGSDRHQFEFEGKNGQVLRQYTLNRSEQVFDNSAHQILAEALPIMFRTTGIDAEARVGRLLKRGGIGAVIDESEQISSDLVMRIYLSSLATQAELDDREVARLLKLMGDDLSSDLEHRLALSAIVEHQDLTTASWLALLKSTGQISSDLEQRLILGLTATHMPDNQDLLEAYVQASNEISSDLEQRLALTALSNYSGFDDATLSRLFQATGNISSDLEQRLTLTQFAEQSAHSPAAIDYIDAIRQIGSDLEARLAFGPLLEAGLDSEVAVLLVEAAAATISSDLELRLLLSDVLAEYGKDKIVRAAVGAAAKEISSTLERQILTSQLFD